MSAEKNHLRSEDKADDVVDFVLPDTYCTVAADRSSADTILFIKVKTSCEAIGKEVNDYCHQIGVGLEYDEG